MYADAASGAFEAQLDGAYVRDAAGRQGPHYGPYVLSVRAGGDGASDDDAAAAAFGSSETADNDDYGASQRRTIRDVFFGDVYLCAGDERMASDLGAALGAARAAAVVAEAAANFSNVRLWPSSSSSASSSATM